jgi:RNA polymerase sigma factor (sigma-70 family)
MCVMSTDLATLAEKPDCEVSEDRITQHARNGCLHCKNHLIEQNVNRLQAFVGRMMLGLARPRRCFSTNLSNALGKFEQYRADSAFLTWLCKIAINEMRQVMRKQRYRRHISIDEGAHGWQLASRAPPCFDAYRQIEIQQSLYQAVERLPVGLRAVIELHCLQELTLADTANLLGLSVAAVKSRCFRAKKLLANPCVVRIRNYERKRP